jgi:transcriptional repressor NrdR
MLENSRNAACGQKFAVARGARYRRRSVQCPYCESDSSVTETRSIDGGLRRRRVCGTCRRRFTTYEKVGSPGLKVEKRDGRTEPFDADKLVRALGRVARGRRELTLAVRRRLARDIEAEIVDGGSRTVPRHALITAALRRLEAVDPLAMARLRANYLDERGALRFEPHSRPRRGDDDEDPAEQLGLPGVDG